MDFFIGFLKKYWSYTLNVFLLVGLIVTTSIFFLQNNENVVIEPIAYEPEETVSRKVYVDVKGAVKKPGVYEMNDNNIINDVIEASGGFTAKAYKNNINLSKKISDEMVIYVYTKTEYKNLTALVKPDQVSCDCDDYVIDSCIDKGGSVVVSKDNTSDDESKTEIDVPPISEENESNKVSINTATKEELMTLNGIGESKALDIIKYRDENGLFKTIDEIKNVSGIGEKAYEKIKDYITV